MTVGALILTSPGDKEAHLPGVDKDLSNIKRHFNKQSIEIHDAIYHNKFKRNDALSAIQEFFSEGNFSTYIIYYSGHGVGGGGKSKGNWAFNDGNISCGDVLGYWRQYAEPSECILIIISDSCYSAQWNQYLKKSDTSDCRCIHILGSSGPDDTSGDSEDDGGDFTYNFVNAHPQKQLKTPACTITKHGNKVVQDICFLHVWHYLSGLLPRTK